MGIDLAEAMLKEARKRSNILKARKQQPRRKIACASNVLTTSSTQLRKSLSNFKIFVPNKVIDCLKLSLQS